MSKIETKEKSFDIEYKVQSSHWWFISRRRLLQSILSDINLLKTNVTLDIGCGVGSNLSTLELTGSSVVGLDRSFYALSLAKRIWEPPLINGDLNHLPIHSGSVGLIIAMDIIEHIDNDLNAIRELYQVLRNGGILILTVPAFKFLWGTQDVVTGHKRRYSKKEIMDKLRKENFNILKSSYFNFFLFFPILLARRIVHLLGLKIESENEINLPMINFFLKTIFSLELYALQYFSFPFGVSIFCIAKKGNLT